MQNERGDDVQWVWFDGDAQRELLRQGYFVEHTEQRRDGEGKLRQWARMVKQA